MIFINPSNVFKYRYVFFIISEKGRDYNTKFLPETASSYKSHNKAPEPKCGKCEAYVMMVANRQITADLKDIVETRVSWD